MSNHTDLHPKAIAGWRPCWSCECHNVLTTGAANLSSLTVPRLLPAWRRWMGMVYRHRKTASHLVSPIFAQFMGPCVRWPILTGY